MSKSETILNHRNYLIARLLSRNPMIHFKPSERGCRKIDFCNLFKNNPITPIDNRNPAISFQTLMEKKKVEITLPVTDIARRLRKMKEESNEQQRATGLPSCFFTWPFVHIPCAGATSKVAPLLFWQIKKININGQQLTISITDASPQFNFMLQAWLEIKEGLSLDFSTLVADEQGAEISIIPFAKRIDSMIKRWEGCHNDISEQEPYTLHKYEDKENQLAVIPCAALGIVNFKYLTLLRDLENLAEKAEKESCALLDEFLVKPSEDVKNPPIGREPQEESEKYLIEQTDASQEQAIWQARESKVMLLDGPPGTGKSQTIVNLIADALNRKEVVALVCHQPAALDVVKKRLVGKNLGYFAQKIIDPRRQRREIITYLRNISEGINALHINDNTRERESYGTGIAELEKSCKQAIESCEETIASSGGGKSYSMRGNFRGIISDIFQKIGFDPFYSEHEEFTQAIEEIMVVNRQNLQQYKDELKKYALDYNQCDFDNNLWQKATQNVAGIVPRFNSPIQLAMALDKCNHLPAVGLLPILFDDMVANFSHQFFNGEKKNLIKKMGELIKFTRQIFSNAGIPVKPIWEKIYSGTGGEEYKRYRQHAQSLATIISVKAQQQNNLIATFMQHHHRINVKMDDWEHVLESVCSYLEYQKMPPLPSINHKDISNQLKDIMYRKQESDSAAIGANFMSRIQAAENLNQQDLLRLRRYQNRRASTIRDICHRGMDDFRKVFPALLMNPDSMCQILPLKQGVIDLAIVDEASQMFVADALPILYRAKKIVISGDKMQMPPDDTFAMRSSNDDEDDEDETDSSSSSEVTQPPTVAADCTELLEAADILISNSNKSRCKLSVHYRSRPAELIAFSNHAFYHGRLQAAPDNAKLLPPLTRPIEMIHVAGIFANSTNEKEINEIIECLRTIWLNSHQPLSVGVIVFNIKQATRLKDRLDEECENDSTFREAYQAALSMKEDGEDVGFFARSVEHVQGDERDIIILGTTYNTTGFYGPLNRKDKGRRRLNVAVTRAKHGMYVITSLDIGGISNDGQRPDEDGGSERWFLWKFMEYARAVSEDNPESAASILRSINPRYDPRPVGEEPESQFEKDVGDYIRGINYAVDYQIGEDGFRIDLGVKRNAQDKRYLCGIECDGRYWHEGWRARYNDVWRQGILEDKGWKIHRIWSDHWYDNADDTKNKLREYLKSLEEQLF